VAWSVRDILCGNEWLNPQLESVIVKTEFVFRFQTVFFFSVGTMSGFEDV